MSNELITKPDTEIERAATDRLGAFMKHWGKGIERVLPQHLTKERVLGLLVNNIRKTPDLLNTSPASFVNAVVTAANLGLEIRPNSAYLLPYGRECTLVIDYRGKMELARRAGCGAITAELVREWDEFDYGFTAEGRSFVHKPLYFRVGKDGRKVPVGADERGEVVLGYGAAQLPNGSGWQVVVMTLGEIEAIRKASKSGRKDLSFEDIRALDISKLPYKERVPWITHWDEQAKKTLVHRLCKGLPQTAEIVRAQEIDDAIETGAPMPLAEQLLGITIDPEFDKPLLPTGSREEQERVRNQKLAAIKSAQAPAMEIDPSTIGFDVAPAGVDPNATVTDERAEEVKEAMQAAGWNRKQAEKLWSDLGVNNAYGLTNKKADLALATIAGKEAVVTSH